MLNKDNDREAVLRFTEAERVVVSTEPDDNGAYIGYIKSEFIPEMPRSERERDMNFTRIYNEAIQSLETFAKSLQDGKEDKGPAATSSVASWIPKP